MNLKILKNVYQQLLKKHTDCENKRKELEDVIKNIKKQLEQKTGENKENIVGSEASKKVSKTSSVEKRD